MKLGNFKALDPKMNGGLPGYSNRDKEVWERFIDDREELHGLANEIRAGAEGGVFPDGPVEGEDEVEEAVGRRLKAGRTHARLEVPARAVERLHGHRTAQQDAAMGHGPARA
jgi:hypothetical protein